MIPSLTAFSKKQLPTVVDVVDAAVVASGKNGLTPLSVWWNTVVTGMVVGP